MDWVTELCDIISTGREVAFKIERGRREKQEMLETLAKVSFGDPVLSSHLRLEQGKPCILHLPISLEKMVKMR